MAFSEAFEQAAADLRLEAEKTAREHGISITFVATRGDSLAELHRIARLAGSLAVRLVRAKKWPVTVVP
jgi:hypothetical protein